MVTQETQRPGQNAVERNTRRIDKLVYEVEKLIELLEDQRLVEPAALIHLKKELRAIERSD